MFNITSPQNNNIIGYLFVDWLWGENNDYNNNYNNILIITTTLL